MTPSIPERLAAALSDYRAGRLGEAEAIARAVRDDQPTDANAWFLLGLIARGRGDAKAAVPLIRRAVALEPRHAAAWKTLGGLAEDGLAARSCYGWALALQPHMTDALLELAQALLEVESQAAAAVALLRRGVALAPEDGAMTAALGKGLLILASGGDGAAAEGRRAEGGLWLRRAMRTGSAEAYFISGTLLAQQFRFEEALACFRQTVALQPTLALAWLHRGLCAHKLSRFDEAAAALEEAIRRGPELRRDAMISLAAVHGAAGRSDRARALDLALLAEWPGDPQVLANLLFRRVYDDTVSAEQLLAEHRAYAAALPPPSPPVFANAADPARRLRVGYVSADFRRHPVAYFLEGILAAHDRRAVEVFCYSDVAVADEVTARLRGLADGWRRTAGLDHDALERLIREDGVDVLVDLAGHSGGNRLPVFARRAAPVQLSWLGYLCTTGLETIDGVIACPALAPPGEETWFSEPVIRLSGFSMCYRPPQALPEPAVAPVTRTGVVTFGCFNNPLKIRPPVIDAWCRILAATPGARLALKYRNFADPRVLEDWRGGFAARGIDPVRIGFAGGSDYAGYMAAYGAIDIALDPFPYNGGTTTAEALWMGVPVIALRGHRFASRLAAAMLDAVGHPELIAESLDDYVAKAVALAGDTVRLAALRPELRRAVLASRLAQAEPVARDLEAVMRELWRGWCSRLTTL